MNEIFNSIKVSDEVKQQVDKDFEKINRKHKLKNMKKALALILFQFCLILFLLIGWIKCIYKSIDSNWDPIDKREIIYTAGVFLGYGGIIGWIEIEDK